MADMFNCFSGFVVRPNLVVIDWKEKNAILVKVLSYFYFLKLLFAPYVRTIINYL